jgi:AraC-like DNA-binding protein
MNKISRERAAPCPSQAFDTVHARLLRFFPELVEALGGNHEILLHQAGIATANFQIGQQEITYRQLVDVIERAAAELHCPDFGMRLATLQSDGVYGPLGQVMKHSKTFGEGLAYTVTHSFAHSLAASMWLSRAGAEPNIFVGHDILLDRMPNKSQAMEQLLLVGHLSAMANTGGAVRVRKVHFKHQPISSMAIYRRYFRCDVRFGQNEYGVFFADKDLACPIIGHDAFARQNATSFIDAEFTRHRPPLHVLTRGLIMQRLAAEDCTNERIAAALNLHPRTLHRKLGAEGTSFQQIKDEVRRDVLLYCIEQTDLEFSSISEKLGFMEPSVLSRRCNRWFAASPTKLRAQARKFPLRN